MLKRALVLAILLGSLVLPLPPLAAAREGPWWQHLFQRGDGHSSEPISDPVSTAAADKFVADDSQSSVYADSRDGNHLGGSSSRVDKGAGDPDGSGDGDSYEVDSQVSMTGAVAGGSSDSGPEVGAGAADSAGTVSKKAAASGSTRVTNMTNDDGYGDASDNEADLHGDAKESDNVGNSSKPNSSKVSSSSSSSRNWSKKGPIFGGYDPYLASDDWSSLDPRCPRANLTILPRPCFVFHWVCVHQDTLVTYDWRYSYTNPKRQQLPEIPWVENWNFPAGLGVNTDALKGRGARYRVHLRPASLYEPIAALRNPDFTNCTLPLLIVADFPYNMGEFFAKAVTALDQLSTRSLDDKVTLVLETPMGIGLAPFHTLFMMSYSRYPPITLADLGARGCSDPPGAGSGSDKHRDCDGGGDGNGDGVHSDDCRGVQRPVSWSGEATRPHCFQRLIMCKWDNQLGGGTPLAAVAQRVVATFSEAGMLPQSQILYPGSTTGNSRSSSSSSSKNLRGADPDLDTRSSTTLRVLIESRHGPVRNIKNMEELLEACREMDRRGFSAGPFRHISCASTSFSNTSGIVDRDRFLANIAEVRSAHVLVVLHGAGATNSWFMRQNSSALVELRPCLFGTRFGTWPDKYMPKQHEKNEDVIRYFALNIEDQAQCLQGDIETGLRNHTLHRDSVGWDASFFSRDQHLVLKPGPFMEFIRHVAKLLHDVRKYKHARQTDQLHGYVVPEGLMYGKLGIMKLDEYRATEHPKVIPF